MLNTSLGKEPVEVVPVEGGADEALGVEALHELDDLEVGDGDVLRVVVISGLDHELGREVLLGGHDSLGEEVGQDELALALADEHDEKRGVRKRGETKGIKDFVPTAAAAETAAAETAAAETAAAETAAAATNQEKREEAKKKSNTPRTGTHSTYCTAAAFIVSHAPTNVVDRESRLGPEGRTNAASVRP